MARFQKDRVAWISSHQIQSTHLATWSNVFDGTIYLSLRCTKPRHQNELPLSAERKCWALFESGVTRGEDIVAIQKNHCQRDALLHLTNVDRIWGCWNSISTFWVLYISVFCFIDTEWLQLVLCNSGLRTWICVWKLNIDRQRPNEGPC